MPRGGPQAASWDRAFEPAVAEWLDDPQASSAQKTGVIRGLDRFNRMTLAYPLFARWTLQAVPRDVAAPRVLELGAGHGALSRALQDVMRTQGRPGTVVASDLSVPFCRGMAEDGRLRSRGIGVAALDATALGLSDNSFDVAVFTQSLHHLEPEQVVALLREGTRVARALVLVDGWRHPLMLAISPAFLVLGNYPAFRDGVVSLRRMYSAAAVRHLGQEAGNLVVHTRFAFPAYLHCVVRRAG